MYIFSFSKTYIYLEAYLVLMIFMFLRRNFIIELKSLIPWFCWLRDFLHSMFDVYSWFLFHEAIWALLICECWWLCDFHIHGYISWFNPYLKDFALVFKFILKLVHILHLVEFFKLVKVFSNHILENPYNQRVDGWATTSCMLIIENLFKHVHE